jgi:hypothetical protein
MTASLRCWPEAAKKIKKKLNLSIFELLNQKYFHVVIYDTHWRLSGARPAASAHP